MTTRIDTDLRGHDISPLPKTVGAFVWHFVKQFPKTFSLLFVYSFINGLLMVFWPYLGKLIVEGFQKLEASNGALTMRETVLPAFFLFMGLYLFIYVLKRITHYVRSRNMTLMTVRIVDQVSTYVRTLSYNFFINNFPGHLGNKINDLRGNTRAIIDLSARMFDTAIFMVAALFMFNRAHWVFSAICVVWASFHLTFMIWKNKRWRSLATESSEAGSIATGRLIDSISNYATVKSFSGERLEENYVWGYLKNRYRKYRAARVSITNGHAVLEGMCYFLLYVPTFVAFYVLYGRGEIGLGDIVFMFAAIDLISNRLDQLADQITEFSECWGEMEQAMWVVRAVPTIEDRPNAKALKITKAAIDINNIGFKYISG
ncbi:MAG: ABC transporter transmembrane domain-containing protein, partial [Alphaproteobacteria bacterium]|nr:ABC transporter transmembrane domain-containing protein [Alphaproteobacteria bacterium]